MFRPALFAVLFVPLCGASFAQENAADPPAAADERADREELLKLMREFADSFEQIERNYVSEVDREDLLEAAIDGMVARLDPYSTYLDDEEVARFARDVGGSFSGIGVQILPNPETGRLTVLAPIPGTPAAEAGVRAGDVIVAVDGQDVDGLDQSAVTAMIQGEPGDPVTIGLLRPNADEREEVTIVRANVQSPVLLGDSRRPDGTWNYLLPGEPKVGLLRLTKFGADAERELREALIGLRDAGAKGVILDLRGNPGGLLTQAVAVTDLFLKGGRIVSTAGRNVAPQAFDALPGGPAEDLAVVVLIDRFSASASEIVAAALQDAGRAAIVGERTWGKGSVQSVIEMGGGRTALKLTTAGYKRPSGANIQRPGPMEMEKGENDDWGVRPDDGREVPLTPAQRRDLFLNRFERDRPTDATRAEIAAADPQLAAALAAVRERIAAGE